MAKTVSPQRAQSQPPFLFALLCALFALCGSTFAQDTDELMLSVHRDWGFGSGSQIQGLFTLEATGPGSLTSVTFKIDGAVIGEAAAPPFKIQFKTDDYPAGWHDLTAVGATSDGRTLTSSTRRFEFVAAEYAWGRAQRLMIGVGGAVMALALFGVAVQFLPSLFGKRKSALPPGAPRAYGLKGGAVCPKCRRPYSIHLLSFNLFARVLDRCDHCGRWSLVRRASPGELRAAETAELARSLPEAPVTAETPEEKLRRQLEESRFVDDL